MLSALRVTLAMENAVYLVGGRFDLMNNNLNNTNQHIHVACITLKFAIKTIAFHGLKEWILWRHTFSFFLPFVFMVVVTRSFAEETTIMAESKLSLANTPATTFSSIVITMSLKDELLSTSSSTSFSVYAQQQEESILLTTTSSGALSSSVFKATTSPPPSAKETESGIQLKAKVVSQAHIGLFSTRFAWSIHGPLISQ